MKKSLLVDTCFMLLLAILLVALNESNLITLEDHAYLYIALLAAYFTGRRISLFLEKRKVNY